MEQLTSSRYRALLFDLDGTLANTIGDINAAMASALLSFGYPPVDEAHCMQFVGNGLSHALRLAFRFYGRELTEAELSRAFAVLEGYYLMHPVETTYPYQGVPEFLAACSNLGLHLGIYSNKADELVQGIVRTLFPEIPFISVHGLIEGFPRKPAADGIIRFLEEVGCTKDEILYIGDSEVDWKTAEAAQVDSAIVTWGFRSKAEMEALGITRFADSLEELKEYL